MGVLAEDDFGGFPVGPLYEPYSALGEYHVPGNLRRYGIWTESTVYHAWRSAIWMVLEEEGHHVLEQTRLSRHRTPILTCGDGSWEDCEISVRMRPLSVQGEAGIVFRYRDCRSFYVAGFRDGEMFIGAREHEERETLASAPAEYLDSGYFDMKVTAAGSRLRAEGAGVVLEAEDARYGKGKAGLLAECPVRFTDFWVEGDAGKAAAARRRRVSEEERERAGYPKAVLKERFPLKDFGTGRQIRFGDIDGDGRKEIVLAQCIHRASGDFPSINLLTALKSSGEVLWQIGEASPGRTIATADLPFQAADVDGDGQTEVIFIKDHFIHVAEGATGKIKTKAPCPVAPDPKSASWYTEHSGGLTHYHRINGDSFALAKLRAGTRGYDFVIKDRYANVWAYTTDMEEMWHATVSTGHFPLIKDVDGDGLDEVFAGYALFDSDGRKIYELDYGDHVDGIACERLSGRGGEYRVALSAGEEGFILCDLEGKVKAKHMLGHVQKLSVGNFMPERAGLEICTINYWGNPGITAFYDAEGNILRTLEPMPYASPIEPVNWTGDGQALVFLSGHPEEGGLMDGHGRRVVTFPDDGHPWLCGAAADVSGDERDEIVLWDMEEMAIYTPDGESRGVKVRHSPEHNMSNYRASVLVPAEMEGD